MQKALFLDRDGIINEDYGYVYKRDDFKFTQGIFTLLKDITYPIFVITNQSGIGRGYYSQKDFEKITKYMVLAFAKEGVEITKVYYCPHAPQEKCQCRKPSPQMIIEAAKEFDIDLKNSIFIGDKESDMQAAQNAGIGRKIILGKKSEFADEAVEKLEDIKGL